MTKRDLRGQEAQWAQELASYNFQLIYRPGKLNPADRLSPQIDYGIAESPKPDQKRIEEVITLDQGLQACAILAMVTHLQTQGGNPDHIPVLNSNQEFKEALQRAERTHDTTAQLPAPILNRQSEEDPQRDPKARKIGAKPPEPVPVLVEEHKMLLQASNGDQLGFQGSPSRNQSKRNRLIAGTGGLELRVPRSLVHKAVIPTTAYDETPKSLVILLWKAQQGGALVDT